MRLIDADALLERRKSVYIEYIDDEDFEENCDDAFVVLAKHVINAPTIEAEPVKHGRWETTPILRTDPDGDWVSLEYHCSLCNRLEYRKENYCPNCGAKMLEVTE